MNVECDLIAEVAQAHDGSLGNAYAAVDAAAAAGATAVKFQVHIASAESTAREPWRVKFSKQDASRYDYWKRMGFTAEQWSGLREHAASKNLGFIVSPFSIDAVRMIAPLAPDGWKVASGELDNAPMLDEMAQTPARWFVSTGMSPWSEIDRIVAWCRSRSLDFTVLHCTTAYPCPAELTGLNVIGELRGRYACRVGLSDHSGDVFAGLAAFAVGAEALEVHVTFHRDMFGPDTPASVTFEQLRELADGARFIRTALAHPVDKDEQAARLAPLRAIFARSAVASRDLPAGTVIADGDIAAKKPAGGLPAAAIPAMTGRTLRRQLRQDEPIAEADLE